jgi:Glycosyl transferase family 11
MILIQIWGGLGNQMFQFSAAYSLALKNKTQIGICLDRGQNVSSGDNFTKREFELTTLFNLPITHFVEPKLINFYAGENLSWFEKVKHKLKRIDSFQETSTIFDPQLFELGSNSLIDGYFQSEKYFSTISDQLRKAFSFNVHLLNEKSKLLKEKISVNTVGIHVRRGDYVSKPDINNTHGTCSVNYYREALDLLDENKIDQIIIFSDDPEWVHANLKFRYPTTIVDWNIGGEAWQDMFLLSLCHHFIIANSSFSWWAAWLSSYSDKVVVAPAQWFKDKEKNYFTQDLLPESWIRI